jgi:hypothetical protein
VNMRLRHWWMVLLLGGLLVMLVGSASPTGAAACKADHFTVLLAGPIPVDLSALNHSLTATVTARSAACNDAVDTSYKGATLSASGTNADGTTAAHNAAGIGDVSLKFRQGVAAAAVTPSSDGLGVKLTATDDADASITGSSIAFNVFDKVEGCETSDCGGTIGSTKGAGGTEVTVDLPEALDGFLGLSLGNIDPSLTAEDCLNAPTDVAPFGQAYVIAPPSDPDLDTYTATVRFGKKLVNGIGNPHFVHCMATPTTDVDGNTVLAYEVVPLCDNQTPEPKCILDQRKNNAGELVVTFLLSAGDPGGIGFG